jgi:hypothetical protein
MALVIILYFVAFVSGLASPWSYSLRHPRFGPIATSGSIIFGTLASLHWIGISDPKFMPLDNLVTLFCIPLAIVALCAAIYVFRNERIKGTDRISK